jgi:hypothetical protein
MLKNGDNALFYACTYTRNLHHVKHGLLYRKLLLYTPGVEPFYKVVDKSVSDKFYTVNAKRPYSKETAAHVAAANGDKDIIAFLFTRGWLPMSEDSAGNNVGDWAEAGGHHLLKEWVHMMERNRLQKLQLAKLKMDQARSESKRTKREIERLRLKERGLKIKEKLKKKREKNPVKNHGHYFTK